MKTVLKTACAALLLAGAIGYKDLDEAWSSYERLLVSRLKIATP